MFMFRTLYKPLSEIEYYLVSQDKFRKFNPVFGFSLWYVSEQFGDDIMQIVANEEFDEKSDKFVSDKIKSTDRKETFIIIGEIDNTKLLIEHKRGKSFVEDDTSKIWKLLSEYQTRNKIPSCAGIPIKEIFDIKVSSGIPYFKALLWKGDIYDTLRGEVVNVQIKDIISEMNKTFMIKNMRGDIINVSKSAIKLYIEGAALTATVANIKIMLSTSNLLPAYKDGKL